MISLATISLVEGRAWRDRGRIVLQGGSSVGEGACVSVIPICRAVRRPLTPCLGHSLSLQTRRCSEDRLRVCILGGGKKRSKKAQLQAHLSDKRAPSSQAFLRLLPPLYLFLALCNDLRGPTEDDSTPYAQTASLWAGKTCHSRTAQQDHFA